MRSPAVFLAVTIAYVSCITFTKAHDRSQSEPKSKQLLNQIEKHIAGIEGLIRKPANYTTKEITSLSARWLSFLKMLSLVDNHRSIPRKHIFQIMKLNLIIMRTVNPETIEFYETPKLAKLLLEFGKVYRSMKNQIDETRKARHEFQFSLKEKIRQIHSMKHESKNNAIISSSYARLFNEAITFSDVDDLCPELAVQILDLDNELLNTTPPILNASVLRVRHHPQIEEEMGRMINRIHHNKRNATAINYVSNLHKHYRELHAAYVIAFKAKKEILNESEKDKLIRNWVAAMKKHQFYMKYVDGFRLNADNKIRFHAIRHLLPKIDFLHKVPDVRNLYLAMSATFTAYEKTFNENITLLDNLERFTKNNSQNPEEWLKLCDILATDDLEFNTSSAYIFKLLKADLEFVGNNKIVSTAVKAHRNKQLPFLGHAISSMYVYNEEMDELYLHRGFEAAVHKFDEFIQVEKLMGLVDILATKNETVIPRLTNIWKKLESILTHYAPYFTELLGTIEAQHSIVKVHDRVLQWGFFKLGRFKEAVNEMRLNLKLFKTIKELEQESDEMDDEYKDLEWVKKPAEDGKENYLEHHLHGHVHYHQATHHSISNHDGAKHERATDSKHIMCELLIIAYRTILEHHRSAGVHVNRQIRIEVHQFERQIFVHRICKFGTNQMKIVRAFHDGILR